MLADTPTGTVKTPARRSIIVMITMVIVQMCVVDYLVGMPQLVLLVSMILSYAGICTPLRKL